MHTMKWFIASFALLASLSAQAYSSAVTPALAVVTEAPHYPVKARKYGIEGVVLLQIKLDENGDVLVGQDALHSLRRAFEHGDIVLDNDAMNTLMDIIHESLPPEVAQQTAKIVK